MGMTEGKWLKKDLKRDELYGKTLGLVGVGNIGSEVAKRARAFGMNVKAFDKFIDSSDWAELVPDLDSLVDGADYISLHLPLTDETLGMINADVIAKMKPGARLINTGRGGCIDADAVVAALDSGQLAAYATDVWPSDPPPEDYPILKAPNVLMTPHLGASSRENLLRIGDEVEAIITQFNEGS
jgi:D-3-phosphoglycerate dehydrogenase